MWKSGQVRELAFSESRPVPARSIHCLEILLVPLVELSKWCGRLVPHLRPTFSGHYFGFRLDSTDMAFACSNKDAGLSHRLFIRLSFPDRIWGCHLGVVETASTRNLLSVSLVAPLRSQLNVSIGICLLKILLSSNRKQTRSSILRWCSTSFTHF